jgi:hypothetical protein
MAGIIPLASFIERARDDHAACNREVRNAIYTRDSRLEMVGLLGHAIETAVTSNDDRMLHVTYRNIHALIQGWYFEGPIKERIRTTLNWVDGGRLLRLTPGLSPEHLSLQHAERLVRDANTKLTEAVAILTRTLEEKDVIIVTLEKDLSTVRLERDRLKKENEDFKHRRLQSGKHRYSEGGGGSQFFPFSPTTSPSVSESKAPKQAKSRASFQ